MRITRSEVVASYHTETLSVWYHREYQIYIMLEGNEALPFTEIGEWERLYSSTKD